MGRKWESFNDRSMRVLQLGNQVALSTRSDGICTEHLLLGLLRAGTGVETRVFAALGVDLTSLKSSVLSVLPPACDPEKWRKVPFSSLAVRVFDYAREEAASLGKSYVSPVHLLLGLLKVDEGAASKVLASFGVTYGKARDSVMKIADGATRPRVPRSSPGPRAQKPADEAPEEPRADSDLIEKTKREIRRTVVEVAELAQQDVSQREFFRVFLDRVVTSLAAKGGAVWTLGESGTLKLADHINLPENLREDRQQNVRWLLREWVAAFVRRVRSGKRQNRDRHATLLQKTLSDGKGVVVEPRWDEGGEQAGNPTDHLLILGPLEVDQEPKGIVEIFQRPGAPPTTQRGYLKFLLQMCDLANGYLKKHE